MDIIKAWFGTSQYKSRADTTADSPDPNPDDIWALTDPDARDRFERQGRLGELEHDLRFEVMRGGPWEEDELEYKREIRRLLREGSVVDKGTYWHASPFSTVYRAIRSGSLNVGEAEFKFRRGDEIVFQCRMTRDMNRRLKGPFFIGRLEPTRNASLCGEMSGAMKGMRGRT